MSHPRTSQGSAKLALQRLSDPANLSLDWRTVTRDLPRSPSFEGFGALGAPYLGRFRGLPFRPGPAGFKAAGMRMGEARKLGPFFGDDLNCGQIIAKIVVH